MYNLFNDPEWAILPTHNYLLIHKNGCSYVRSILKEYYKEYDEYAFVPQENHINPCWTVIRDPCDRFISGLAYDLWMTGVSLDHAFENLQTNINETIPTHFKTTGKISHTITQVNYVLFQPMSFFVDIKDLTVFCQINFGLENSRESKNKVPNDYKLIVKEEINKRNLKQSVEDLLSYETFFYNKLMKSNHIWRWQNGNVLGTSL